MDDFHADIRPFQPGDAAAVTALFVRINRALAPEGSDEAFERYIERSIEDEIGKIPAYYDGARNAGFWVAMQDRRLAGFFGLEPCGAGAVELRRMYVAPEFRRRGIARRLLARAESIALEMGYRRIDLSTSELQAAALALYRHAGYEEIGETVAEEQSHKTIGGGIHRYQFAKRLGA